MILQGLCDLYERLAEDPFSGIAPVGWSSEKVAFGIMLSDDGVVQSVIPFSSGEGKNLKKFRIISVPEHAGRSGKSPKPYFLCDTAKYFFAMDEKSGEKRFADSRKLHEDVLRRCSGKAAKAILAFFARGPHPDELRDADREGLEKGGFAVLCSSDTYDPLSNDDEIREAWSRYRSASADDEVIGCCSVTGKRAPLARLFPMVAGLPGAQSSGASLVSFNFQASESYGKKQTYNASISQDAATASGSALKYLLSDRSRRISLGDTFVVFWADRSAPFEDRTVFSMLLGAPKAEDEETLQRIQNVFERLRSGMPTEDMLDGDITYDILGVAPNAARLSVRFFEQDRLGDIAENVGWYLRDIAMVGVKPTSLHHLLCQTAPSGKEDKIPSTFLHSCFEAMIRGTMFPFALRQLLLERLRSDHGTKNRWDLGQRAALLKACLVRTWRKQGYVPTDEERIDVSLNRENANEGYLLGRMFAVMARAQLGAVGDTNATIVERYIGSISTTPNRVFQTLMRGFHTHLSTIHKKRPGLAVVLSREMDEIIGGMSGVDAVPSTLSSDEQCEFYIGYHQERQVLWASKREVNESADNGNDAIEED